MDSKTERRAIIFQRSDPTKTKCVDDGHVSCSIYRLAEVNLQTNQKKTTETESEGLRLILKGPKFLQILFVFIIKTMCVCSVATQIFLSGICYGGKKCSHQHKSLKVSKRARERRKGNQIWTAEMFMGHDVKFPTHTRLNFLGSLILILYCSQLLLPAELKSSVVLF